MNIVFGRCKGSAYFIKHQRKTSFRIFENYKGPCNTISYTDLFDYIHLCLAQMEARSSLGYRNIEKIKKSNLYFFVWAIGESETRLTNCI